MVVLAALGLMEFYGLVEKRGLGLFQRGWGILGGVLLMLGTFLHLHGQARHSRHAGARQRFRNQLS